MKRCQAIALYAIFFLVMIAATQTTSFLAADPYQF